MTDDTLTAALDEIRERRALIDDPDVAFAVAAKRMAATMRDFPRLLAALDEVLKLHTRRDQPVITTALCVKHSGVRVQGILVAERRVAVRACPDCTVTEKYVCIHCRHECPDDDDWPCPTYEAISRALMGEDPDG
jgi:hypothetical protein